MSGIVKQTVEEMAKEKQLDGADIPQIIPVLLAGGRGQRLWPLSRASHPKPFVRFLGRPSLFEKTWHRLMSFDDVIVCGNVHHHKAISEQIPADKARRTQIILEPSSKGTAPAAAMAAHYLKRMKPGALMCVMPTDHFIGDTQSFLDDVLQSARYALDGRMISMVREASSNSCRYGYFKVAGMKSEDQAYANDVYRSHEFIEKPTKDKIVSMMNGRDVFWNTGIILCRPSDFLDALEAVDPQLYEQSEKAVSFASRAKSAIVVQDEYFDPVRPASIDRAILENTDDLYIRPLRSAWRDNGTWGSFLGSVLSGS